MSIDFAGDKLSQSGPLTREKHSLWRFFVAILPCSQLTYVEAVMSQKN